MIMVLLSLLAGGLAGYLFLPPGMVGILDQVSMLALYLLVFLVGVEIGTNRKVLKNLKILGKNIIRVSGAALLGTLVGGIAAGLIFGMPGNISLAIASGFGWYSLSGVLLKELAGTEVGTIAFIANVFRELFAFLLIPWLAVRLNYQTAIAPAGATSMDTTLPLITQSTDEETAVVAFGNGFILSSLVPVLVPLMYSLPFK